LHAALQTEEKSFISFSSSYPPPHAPPIPQIPANKKNAS